jgi:hypothetical protein
MLFDHFAEALVKEFGLLAGLYLANMIYHFSRFSGTGSMYKIFQNLDKISANNYRVPVLKQLERLVE